MRAFFRRTLSAALATNISGFLRSRVPEASGTGTSARCFRSRRPPRTEGDCKHSRISDGTKHSDDHLAWLRLPLPGLCVESISNRPLLMIVRVVVVVVGHVRCVGDVPYTIDMLECRRVGAKPLQNCYEKAPRTAYFRRVFHHEIRVNFSWDPKERVRIEILTVIEVSNVKIDNPQPDL